MEELHGQRVSIARAGELSRLGISRRKCLDSGRRATTANRVARGEDLLFLGNDVAESFKKSEYALTIHGILPCGSKCTLSIVGVRPFIDIRLREGETDAAASARVARLRDSLGEEDQSGGTCGAPLEFMDGHDFMLYDHRVHRYARVRFRTLKARAGFVDLCSEQGVKTYSNDKSSYYRVVARSYELNLSGWSVLRRYTRLTGTTSKAEYCLEVDVNDMEAVTSEEVLASTAQAHGLESAAVKYESMIVSSFDIEMIPARAGCFPDADKNPEDSIFMICVTYHFAKTARSVLSVCLTLKQCDPVDGVLLVHCKTEGCLLAAFAKLTSFMQPDFITEFNGGGFDWRNVITKVQHCGVLAGFLQDMSLVRLLRWETTPSMLSRFHRETRIKINGATADAISRGFKMQGFVGFDTLIVFKQLEPNADSHKLNECLRRCNLGGKDDLAVEEMFRIYREGSAAEMSLVAHYCFVDTVKLQALLMKKNVVQDRREVANLSFTSISDTFNFAGGSRMRNLLMNRGAKLGYFFDTLYRPVVEDAEAKFPGAYVVPPLKGVAAPMLRLDEFLRREGVPEADMEAGLRDGYAFLEANFECVFGHGGEKKEEKGELAGASTLPATVSAYVEYARAHETHYPISGLDFASLYPSIIMTYNVSPEKLIVDEAYAEEVRKRGRSLQYVTFPFCGQMKRAWFVRHDNVEDEYSVCGKLLIELFARRAEVKRRLRQIADRIDELRSEADAAAAGEAFARQAELDDAEFDYAGCDSKQKAVKIFMNTLYGEMGNFLSCICAVEVSASVTTMGRHNLRLAKSFVEESLGMKVYYGDSVAGETPIMIKRVRSGVATKELVPIEELGTKFELYGEGKECTDYETADIDGGIYVMTENGYSKVKKLIRHRTNKKLYRVTTCLGTVIVTEDHSLLDEHKKKIKPNDCVVGTKLLHWGVETNEIDEPFARMTINDEEIGLESLDEAPNDVAYVKGFFFGDGSCDRHVRADGKVEHTFALTNSDIAQLSKCVEIFNAHYKDVQLNITETIGSSGVYRAVAVGEVSDLESAWHEEFYSARKLKKVPAGVLNGCRATKLAFMRGYFSAAGDKTRLCLSNKGQIGTQGLQLLMMDLGYSVSVSTRQDEPEVYSLAFTKGRQLLRKNPTAIKSIDKIDSAVVGNEQFVYDLETESHHFAAGVGTLVVHNTDSLYAACAPRHFAEPDRAYFLGRLDKVAYATQLVETTFKQIEIAKRLVNEHLRADNGAAFLKMAYEEVLYPVAFLSKKKYYGVPHEERVDFFPRKLFLRGLEVVKRGSSEVLKDVVNEALRTVMDIRNTRSIVEVVKDAIARVFNTPWPVDAFAKTKVYRPDKNNVAVLTMIDRYRLMDYHTIPEPNVRFKYVICKYYPWTYDIQGRQTKGTIGACMELVERVHEEGLEIDLEYYFDNELTGQFARLITYCDEVAASVPVVAALFPSTPAEGEQEAREEDLTAIERDALAKQQYQRSEDALFKAGKRYVALLAKHFSKAFVNKGSLFANTWREACGFICARADLRARHLHGGAAVVFGMFADASGQDMLLSALTRWTMRHIARRYRVALSPERETLLSVQLMPAVAIVEEAQLQEIVTDYMTMWKRRVVAFIREEYDYDFICKNNLPFQTIWDVLTRQELEFIVQDPKLFPGISVETADDVIDQVSRAIAKTLATSELCAA